MENWAELDRKNQEAFDRDVAEAMKRSAADRDFFTAARNARWDVQHRNLWPKRDESGELEYTQQQGAAAACLAREDAATTVALQLLILRRLDRNRNYLAVAIALLLILLLR